MGLEIKQTQDICVDKLTVTRGEDLQIMANLTGPGQLSAIMEGHIYSFLGSRYVPHKADMLLRLTVSHQGRGRTDLVTIAQRQTTPGFMDDEVPMKTEGGGL